jgi:Cystathionine beta-lyases/cystathionine gamma-synthases
VHSVTKALSGHSDVLVGAVIARDEAVVSQVRRRRSLLGAVPGPMEAWLALRGLRTLAVRMDRAEANAAVLASRLSAHPVVTNVRYPGLPAHPAHELARRQLPLGCGSVLSFQVAGGAVAAETAAGACRLIVHATSLGGVESLIERRGTELEFVIMVIAVSCVKLLSAHNSTQHTSRKHKV